MSDVEVISCDDYLNFHTTMFSHSGRQRGSAGLCPGTENTTKTVTFVHGVSGQDILEAVDENNDGEISRAEFVENAMRSGFIRNLIGE